MSGSDSRDSDISVAYSIGYRLAEHGTLCLASLAGPAALNLSFGFANHRNAIGAYDPRDIEFHFRVRTQLAPPLEQRTGMAIYTGLDKESLRRSVLDECRAAIAIGGGTNTAEEIALASEIGVPVLPLAHTKGAAGEAYLSGMETMLCDDEYSANDRRDWAILDRADGGTPDDVIAATHRLIEHVAYLPL